MSTSTEDKNPSESASVVSIPPTALQDNGISTTWCWSESCRGAIEAHARVMALEQQQAHGMRVEVEVMANALQKMGIVAVEHGVFAQAAVAYDKLLQVAYQHGIPQWAGAAHANLGCLALTFTQPDLAYWHFQQEVELARTSDDQKWEGRARFKVAKCILMQPRISDGAKLARAHLENACNCAEAAGDSDGLARAMRLLEACPHSDHESTHTAHTEASPAVPPTTPPSTPTFDHNHSSQPLLTPFSLAPHAPVASRVSSTHSEAANPAAPPPPACDANHRESRGMFPTSPRTDCTTLPLPPAISERARELQETLDTACAYVGRAGTRPASERQIRRVLPVLTYVRALAEVSGRTTMKSRSCFGVGMALWALNKADLAIAWHQKDLKYSAAAGDVAGMQRAVRSLELLLSAFKYTAPAAMRAHAHPATHSILADKGHHHSLALLQELAAYEAHGMTSRGLALIKHLLIPLTPDPPHPQLAPPNPQLSPPADNGPLSTHAHPPTNPAARDRGGGGEAQQASSYCLFKSMCLICP